MSSGVSNLLRLQLLRRSKFQSFVFVCAQFQHMRSDVSTTVNRAKTLVNGMSAVRQFLFIASHLWESVKELQLFCERMDLKHLLFVSCHFV